eukprot:GILI01039686.1.p1 GENE.GILI01039686.1~~GILI01039686.1.p1  ORF type:complete len:349 (-),score=38.03 GILI01039686.1:64-1110(-)
MGSVLYCKESHTRSNYPPLTTMRQCSALISLPALHRSMAHSTAMPITLSSRHFSQVDPTGSTLLTAKFKSFVSFVDAPGFYQAPLEDVGKNVRDCDPKAIQVYSLPELITAEQEQALLKYTSLLFDRLPFQHNHTDNLIYHFKEFYRSQKALMEEDGPYGLGEKEVVEHIKGHISSSEMELIRAAFKSASEVTQRYMPKIPVQDRIHFLRLNGDGFIKAHADESRNSSGIVAGLTLGSGRVMTLTDTKRFPGAKVHLLLAPRSFYVLTGSARYDWHHSVDWIEDDVGHMQRIREGAVPDHPVLIGGAGSEVEFDKQGTGMIRGVRTALIWRGIPPMELLMRNSATMRR